MNMQIPLCDLLAHVRMLPWGCVFICCCGFLIFALVHSVYIKLIFLLIDILTYYSYIAFLPYPLCCCNNVNFPILGQ